MGDARRAAALFGEAVRTLWDMRETTTMAWPLRNLAALAAGGGYVDRAARLIGMVEAYDERSGVASHRPMLPIALQTEAAARAGLGDAAFAAAVAVGRGLPPTDAVAEALAVADLLARGAESSASHPPPSTSAEAIDLSDVNAFGLSPRELQVVRLVAAGRSNREIAAALYISVPTVKRHLTNVLAKLALPSRSALTAFAHVHGLA
jgi:DNA-binding CsgD family transcriptional regulator